jgi:hypothetical protein
LQTKKEDAMKRHSSATSLAFAFLVVLGSTGPLRAKDQVPFRGSFDAVVSVTRLDPPFVLLLADGSGKASQLGTFTFSISNLVNGSNRTSSGSYEFTAANGDTLAADCTGQGTLTATPGVLSIVETATITGGTGRFAGASGGFVSERLQNSAAGWTTGSFEGTISSGGESDGDEDSDDNDD